MSVGVGGGVASEEEESQRPLALLFCDLQRLILPRCHKSAVVAKPSDTCTDISLKATRTPPDETDTRLLDVLRELLAGCHSSDSQPAVT